MEKPFCRILVPFDGSSQSRIAREMAIFLARFFNTQATVLHVVPNGPVSLPAKTYIVRENYAPISTGTAQFPRPLKEAEIREYTLPDGVVQEATENYRLMGQEMLSESIKLFSQKGIPANEKLLEGADVAQIIISEAEIGHYDLVIIGNSSDEKEKRSQDLGSVAKSLSSSLKVPILIVRKKSEISKILIPVDGSASDAKALLKGKLIAKATGSKVVFLHVQETSLLKTKPEAEETGLQILKHVASTIKGVPFEQRLIPGDPAKEIVQIADQGDFDLIVMCRGEHSKLRGVAFGSVTNHVLHHATIPLMIV